MTDQLRVTSGLVEGCVVLTVSGEIDALTAPALLAAIRSNLRQVSPGPLVLDISAVSFLGSAGLAVLVTSVGEGDQQRRPLRIVIGRARPVIRPIEVTGLDGRLPIYETVQEALAR